VAVGCEKLLWDVGCEKLLWDVSCEKDENNLAETAVNKLL
jgi:hypothetical protein